MNPQDLTSVTVYNDLLTVLKERGLSDIDATEIFAKLTAQAELEVVEEILSKLTSDQLKDLDDLAENASATEIAQKLKLDGAEIDAIRAEKTAKLIEDMVPKLNE